MKIFLFLFLLVISLNHDALADSSYNNMLFDCKSEGVTLLYDLAGDKWISTDENLANYGTLPASTFKIINSLIGLDSGTVKKSEVFIWDKVDREFPQWNKDTSFEEAFKNSTVWVYEAIRNRLDDNVYRRYLSWAGYGNGKIYNSKDGNFWVYGDFEVTPKEQISMLVNLYNNSLPFSKDSMNHVKQMMKYEDDSLGELFSKTGWTRKDGKHIGWWVGYILRGQNPIFFATRITRDESDGFDGFLECRKSITRKSIEDNF